MDRHRSPHMPLVSPRHIAALKEAQFTYAVAHTKPEGTLEYFRQLREASLLLLKQAFATAEAEPQNERAMAESSSLPPAISMRDCNPEEASGT